MNNEEKELSTIYYAGIGSRETPRKYVELFKRVGKYLAEQGVVLRSGRADGADEAFEIGCDMGSGKKEIYVPWASFGGKQFNKYILTLNGARLKKAKECIVLKEFRDNPEPYKIAEKYHPQWNILKQGAKKLQARNSHQVLGKDLKTPSSFIICWTEEGKGQGGTGQALRIAKDKDIPIFDCGNYEDINECRKELYEFIKKHINNKKD